TRRTASECPWLNPSPQNVYVFPSGRMASDITRLSENIPGSQPTEMMFVFLLFWATRSTDGKYSGMAACVSKLSTVLNIRAKKGPCLGKSVADPPHQIITSLLSV